MSNSPATTGLHSKTIKGAQWLLVDNILQKVLNIVTFLVLAHKLLPADYGVMAVLFMVTGFFDMVTTPGFEKALLQRPREETIRYLDTAWTFHLIKSFFISFFIFLAAPLIVDFFHIESFVKIIQVGAWLIFIGSLGNSQQLYFFKDFQYHKIFYRDIGSQISYMAVAFFWIVFVEASVWALLMGHMARYATGVILTYVLSSERSHFSFEFKKLRDLFNYSKWVMGQNVVGYVLGILDTIYIGRLLDSARLGLYTKARDLSFSVVAPFFNILNKIGLTVYAEIQDKNAKLQEGFLRSLDIMLGITIPVFFLLLAEGGMIVNVLLGSRWLGIVVPLKILAGATIFSSLVTITKPIFDGIGRPDINFKLNIIQLLASLLFIFVGIKYFGLNGVAWAMAAIWFLLSAVCILTLKSILKLGAVMMWPTIATLGGALFTTLGIAVPMYLLRMRYEHNPLLVIGWLVGLAIVYFFSIKIIGQRFSRGPWQTWLSLWHEVKRSTINVSV
ncbi:MAG: hypothetical protein A2821_03135 [Candidatus Magasanikbacteria bacterium RIFCSPHIGHO2_01_FULL_41_23]|uniref:Uncharacterized protein n=1 Tax=Candidatus Magasanikbacteria bacterium RIFCSPLOWO2_01_FULL_40_15 TaxID=1798686 RepID=A0A1F6N3Y7_9BACT|nr:MAG: hypothetical protein A2821_03135 [Candidatus Magasanikbacteria bacterium RIFCSPHIGHO2_01_FULL_41_23]OGH67332.1 MAG: hypothetical protein A3C66_01150 [Candidatus Magasanikbacteria bacterium RIFCSPHIGHO2_02_FULL_41_35]OGH76557.1 MAG: hypothetical protein A3F22_00360 [Candidatus Magasanikbacteria bacterium RIFCSPHIGHO2_12_FULL_41_16]OGH78458.1 MAG: hypothetical protein A2983_02995 [Candidatus Magasanikbacteria bacterium RIFCSPLOWO2_01_FULL_40_15]